MLKRKVADIGTLRLWRGRPLRGCYLSPKENMISGDAIAVLSGNHSYIAFDRTD